MKNNCIKNNIKSFIKADINFFNNKNLVQINLRITIRSSHTYMLVDFLKYKKYLKIDKIFQ